MSLQREKCWLAKVDLLQHGVPRVAASEKTDAARRKELKQIDAYQALVDSEQAKVFISEQPARHHKLTERLDQSK